MLTTNPNAIHILEKNLYRVNWRFLSLNSNAIHLLEKNLDKVDWYNLSRNPKGVDILKQHFDKVHWTSELLKNPDAVELIKKMLAQETNTDIRWFYLGMNPNVKQIICNLDYEAMKQNCNSFAQELAEYVYHPVRLMRLCDTYGLDLEEYMDLLGD